MSVKLVHLNEISKIESTAKMDTNVQNCTHEQLDNEPDNDHGTKQDNQENTFHEETETSSQLTSQEMRILVAELTPTDKEQSEFLKTDQNRLMRLTHEEKTDTNSPLSSQEMRILIAELASSQ